MNGFYGKNGRLGLLQPARMIILVADDDDDDSDGVMMMLHGQSINMLAMGLQVKVKLLRVPLEHSNHSQNVKAFSHSLISSPW